MKRPERLRAVALLVLAAGAGASGASEGRSDSGYRHRAAIVVTQPAAIVELSLPVSVHALSRQPGLADLRVVDALGNRVPFAMLPPPADPPHTREQLRPAALYALPRRLSGMSGMAGADGTLAAPLELVVQGDRISVRRPGPGAAAPQGVPGWVIDLGEGVRDEGLPQQLRLTWAGTGEFSASFDLDTSAALRDWRPIGSGQLLSLSAAPAAGASAPSAASASAPSASTAPPMVQRDVPLPAGTARFVRLVWRDATSAPLLQGAQRVLTQTVSGSTAAVSTLQLAPVAAGAAGTDTARAAGADTPAPRHALRFDLGGPVPVQALDLALPPGNRVAPVRLQARSGPNEAWRDIGAHVFYRLQREGTVSRSPPWPVPGSAGDGPRPPGPRAWREIRVLPDERSPALDPALTRLHVQVPMARLVLATQGQPPYALLAGSAQAGASALPMATLLPAGTAERPDFGRAELGPWVEQADAARAADAAERRAALRPGLLWAVLLAGVGGLAFMVWRLMRAPPRG